MQSEFVRRVSWTLLNVVARTPYFVANPLLTHPAIYKLLRVRAFALDAIDELLMRDLEAANSRYFVEFGAHDGLTQSMTKLLELNGWTGALVEPLPNVFRRLMSSRSRSNSFFCAAVVPPTSPSQVRLLDANLMSSLVESPISTEYTDKGKEFIRRKIKEIVVEGMTLDRVLAEANAPRRIGFVSVDCGGSEPEILAQTDLSRWFFEFIAVESWRLEEVETLLVSQGYIVQRRIHKHLALFRHSSQ